MTTIFDLTELVLDHGTHDRCSGELGQDLQHLGVVGRDIASLTQVARGARQRHVRHRRRAALARWDDVVEVVHPTVSVEELQDPSLRDLGPHGPLTAVTANAAVPLGDSVPHRGWDVPGISHATILAGWDASKGCKATVPDLIERLIAA